TREQRFVDGARSGDRTCALVTKSPEHGTGSRPGTGGRGRCDTAGELSSGHRRASVRYPARRRRGNGAASGSGVAAWSEHGGAAGAEAVYRVARRDVVAA